MYCSDIVITTTSLPKPSVMEEQEKTKSERRKKAAMFVEQLRQKRAEKIAKETDIVGPLLPHEYKYCNRKYEEPSPAIERVTRCVLLCVCVCVCLCMFLCIRHVCLLALKHVCVLSLCSHILSFTSLLYMS